MLTPVLQPGSFVSVDSTSHQLFAMLVWQRMPLLVLLLLCLLLQSFDALQISWRETAFRVFLCKIEFAHIFELTFRTAFFKNSVFENIWPFPVVITSAHAAVAICI